MTGNGHYHRATFQHRFCMAGANIFATRLANEHRLLLTQD
jgi:hypothetical protein